MVRMYKEQREMFSQGSRGVSKSLLFLLIFAVVLLVLFIFISGPIAEESNEAEGAENETESVNGADEIIEDEVIDDVDEVTENEDPVVYDDSITVPDQVPGDSVVITEMSLNDSRWVVIHEEVGGGLGNILGARLFPEEAVNGEVSLLRGVEEGKSYYAVLYLLAEREEDVGRRFDTNRDLPLIKEGGEIMKVLFAVE